MGSRYTAICNKCRGKTMVDDGGGPYSIATSEADRRIQEEYTGDPLTEAEYHEAAEATLER
ncbi:MAG: hypothetical protein V2J62_02460 [candidate division KSB1 bacterium]|jgi:hypothetical protein|nr:hypothetical protein [candidate division KSB1 bacterium]